MLKAVIFDVDGTLAETEEVHRAAFNAVFEQVGLDWHWSSDVYRELLKVTGGKERLRHYVQVEGLEPLEEDALAGMHRLKTAMYAELLPNTVALRPGVSRLIQACIANSIQMGIATTTTEANVDALAQAVSPHLPLSAFDAVMGGTRVPEKKPNPAVYLAVLDALGVGPQEAIAIEDAEAGVIAACEAGIRCIASPSMYTVSHDLTRAEVIIPHLDDRGDGQPVTLEWLAGFLS